VPLHFAGRGETGFAGSKLVAVDRVFLVVVDRAWLVGGYYITFVEE